jgi:hypothetical protein
LLVAAAPARAAIFGTVTDAATHAGIEDFEVCVYEALPGQAEAEPGFCTTPEPGGEYALGSISAGLYKVAFIPNTGSKYAPEFYDNVRTWNDATVLVVPTATPVDAALEEATTSQDPGTGSDPSESSSPPLAPLVMPAVFPTSPKPSPKPLHCRKGFKKKKVKGKLRCVKIHRPKHSQKRKRS